MSLILKQLASILLGIFNLNQVSCLHNYASPETLLKRRALIVKVLGEQKKVHIIIVTPTWPHIHSFIHPYKNGTF